MLRRLDTGKFGFLLLFIIILIIGLCIFRDYGVHYDEKAQINIAVNNYRYINQGDPALLTFQDRYYGSFFELPLLILFNNLPSPWMLYSRHLAVFFTFLAGLIGFYFLARRLLGNTLWALIAATLFVLHPRLFADSFYNTKDIPFLVFFLLGVYSLIHLLDIIPVEKKAKPVWMAFLLHSIICAAIAAIRLPGLLLMGISAGMIILHTILRPENWQRNTGLLVAYLIVTFGLLVLFMPILWHDPLGEFINAVTETGRYTLWKDAILFQGRSFPANDPVWNYLPVWIGITTPYLQLFSFIFGIVWMFIIGLRGFRTIFRAKITSWKNTLTSNSLAWLVVIAWFAGPVAYVILFRAVLYDGWRQMYFIYPAMLLIGVYGIKRTYEWTSSRVKNLSILKTAFGIILLAGLLEPVFFMVKNHPYEYVYFNRLTGDPATLRHQYDLDYWGLSYKQGIDYILANDKRDHIVISAVGPPSLYVEYVLPQEQASRITFSDVFNADYFLTNYRWHPDDFPYPNKYYSINVRGMEIMTVYRLHHVGDS